jgi:hypothetical protein
MPSHFQIQKGSCKQPASACGGRAFGFHSFLRCSARHVYVPRYSSASSIAFFPAPLNAQTQHLGGRNSVGRAPIFGRGHRTKGPAHLIPADGKRTHDLSQRSTRRLATDQVGNIDLLNLYVIRDLSRSPRLVQRFSNIR